MRVSIRLTAAVVLLLQITFAIASNPACDSLASVPVEKEGASALRAMGLIGLREFGSPGVNKIGGEPFVMSPDGQRIALVLRRAQIDSNDYCSSVVVLKAGIPALPKYVADAGDIRPMTISMYGFSGLVNGAIKAPVVRWSPDGMRIAFSKSVDGIVQIGLVEADGGHEWQLTASPVDIEDFDWLGDGEAIVYRSKPGLDVARKRFMSEGRYGFHYGNRFWPLASATPYLPADIDDEFTAVAIDGGASRKANGEERGVLSMDDSSVPVQLHGAGDKTWRAWLAPADAMEVGLPNDLHIERAGASIKCPKDACADVSALWQLDDRAILYLRRTDPARSGMALLRWEVGAPAPVPLLQTGDVLIGCQLASSGLVCAREGSVTPRRLVRIDPESGEAQTLYDPNPEFARLPLNPVERLYWKNAFGLETFGDLVLPRDRKPGERLPLIVVQYDSRGFLKGGTGDEYPVQLFASRGFAVLNVNQPRSYGLGRGYTDWDQVLRANQQDRMERKSILSSVETGVRILIDRGLVDADRVGITGLSDGASTATFALINSRMFSAVSIGTCCESPAMMTQLGPAFTSMYAGMGYPLPGKDPGYWDPSSLAQNVGKVNPVPILIQASDGEFRMGLETFATLSAAEWPIDMYVFPGEAHIKNQPAHRQAIYERNVAWFEYWLKGSRDESYPRQQEIDHWMSLNEAGFRLP